MNRTKTKNYVVGITIASGFYFVCSIVNAIIHVIIALACGYNNSSDMLEDGNIALTLVIAVLGISLHILVARITVTIMEKYGRKQNCISKWYFISAAISVVVVALVIFPILFSETPGWLLYTSHVSSLLYFGKRVVDNPSWLTINPQSISKKNTTGFTTVTGIPVKSIEETPEEPEIEVPTIQETERIAKPTTQIEPQASARETKTIFYCHNCGAKLTTGIKYCYRCGAKVEDFSKL